MKLIVGLGNPGEKYAKTRHNIGFRAISKLAENFSIKADELKCHSLLGKGFFENEKIILAQPITYMNKSGKAVKSLFNKYNLDLEDLIIIYDDIDLDVGEIRIKRKGSSGGHNGLKSIIRNLGSQKIARIRIGIGRPPAGFDIPEYVLGYFDDEEEKIIQESLIDVVEAVKLIKNESIETAMNKYN
ncbi:MAG: aminoacyl-tRNA hydrolase [Bacillota bacterium]